MIFISAAQEQCKNLFSNLENMSQRFSLSFYPDVWTHNNTNTDTSSGFCVPNRRIISLLWIIARTQNIFFSPSLPVPHAGVGDLHSRRAGVESGEVRQHWRAHEPRPGPAEGSHHAPWLQSRGEPIRGTRIPAAVWWTL